MTAKNTHNLPLLDQIYRLMAVAVLLCATAIATFAQDVAENGVARTQTVQGADDVLKNQLDQALGNDRHTAVTAHGPKPAMPVMVELFTSQGCADCLPADTLMAEMTGRSDVLALSFHVGYWDYLGWEDSFAQPAFTDRQLAYKFRFAQRGLYTPQFIVGGSELLTNPTPAELGQLISSIRALPPLLDIATTAEANQQIVTLTPMNEISSHIEVAFIRYLPYRSVKIEAGENAGKQVEYRNIVIHIEQLAEWDGKQALRLAITPATGDQPQDDNADQQFPSDTRHAIIVQQTGPGQVLAAFKLD